VSPPLSVVVPTFDHAGLLPDVVGRVLAQDGADLELVVVDDGSTDDTAAVLASLADERLVVVHRPNGGISAARNSGIAAARGRYVLFLDDDDRPHPTWAARLLAATETSPAVVCCGARIVDEAGREQSVRRPAPLGPAFADVTGLFLGGTFVVRADVLAEVGGFLEGLQCSHATELALRLTSWCAAHGEAVVVIDEPLVDIVRRPPGERPEASAAKLLAGTELLLAHHEAALRRAPSTLADYHGVAGVAAARLGDGPAARRHLARALRTDPSPRRALRAVASVVPPVRRRLWGTSGG
jgi:hypothetical protein